MTRLPGGLVGALVWASAGVVAQARIEVTFALPRQGLSFGEPFDLFVERSWPLHEPEPFDDKVLAPLSVHLLSVAGPGAPAATQDRPAVERRHYLARAYMVGEVKLPRIDMRGRQGDRVVTMASCTPAPFPVRSILPDPPGDIEWPGPVREGPARGLWRWWLAVVAAALAGGAWWWRRPGPSAAVPPSAVLAPPAEELTFRRLAALGLPDQGRAAVAAFYAELAEILRDHTQRRFSVPAPVRTSPELVAAVPLGRDALQRCLEACDQVKFGAMHPARPGHAMALQFAESFVRATVREPTP